MKHLLLALLLICFSSALADTPDAIIKDYRKAAATALAKLNETLEKATTPIISQLLVKGDTAEAEQLTSQLKAKLAGESVPRPHAKATLLFAQYDQARAKALEPAQKASFARIDTLLKSVPGSPKLETLTELAKVRAEIEEGTAAELPNFPVKWSYHQTLDGPGVATLSFFPDGRFELDDYKGKQTGTWKPGTKPSTLAISCASEVWKVTLNGESATMERGKVGTRYLKAKPVP